MRKSNDERGPGCRNIRVRCQMQIMAAILLLAGLATNAAAEDAGTSQLAEVSARCERPGDVAGSAWSQAERWLWQRVCGGKNSDLRNAPGGDTKIRPEVLREIVTSGTVTDPVAHKRIGILRMHVPGRLDLSDADIDRALIIAESTIDGGLLLDRVRTHAVLSFESSTIAGPIWAHGVEIEGSLILRKARFESIEINGSQIHGTLDLAGAQVRNDVEIAGSAIGGSIMMNHDGRYGEVRLRSASVGRQINFQDAVVKGQLEIQEARTPGSVLLDGGRLGEIRIVGSTIGGTLAFDRSTVAGHALIGSNSIGLGLRARHAIFKDVLDITLNRINGNIDLRGSTLMQLDLSETDADKALQLASEGHNIRWTTEANPRINLHQLHVGSLQDARAVWPERLERELDGFVYGRFGGLQSESSESGYGRSAEWLIRWLEADASYSPQPYEHLAQVLDEAGQYGKAADIRVANRDRERGQYPIASFEWVWLGFLKLVVGYGYGNGPFRLLFGLLLLAVCGTFAAAIHTAGWTTRREGWRKVRWGTCFWYSLDTAVPVLRLRDGPYEEPWSGCIKYYFYVHRILGWVIALCVVAVLTRLLG